MGFGDVDEVLEDGGTPSVLLVRSRSCSCCRKNGHGTRDDKGNDIDVVKPVLERMYPGTQFGATVFVTDRERILKKKEKF
jgi:hypothetical protein